MKGTYRKTNAGKIVVEILTDSYSEFEEAKEYLETDPEYTIISEYIISDVWNHIKMAFHICTFYFNSLKELLEYTTKNSSTIHIDYFLRHAGTMGCQTIRFQKRKE
jgi:hypothetical protein